MTKLIPKFKVGQKVRLKSLKKLTRLGRLKGIRVNFSFRYSSTLLKVSDIDTLTYGSPVYRFSNYEELSCTSWWYHEDFLQSIRQLPDHLEGKL